MFYAAVNLEDSFGYVGHNRIDGDLNKRTIMN